MVTDLILYLFMLIMLGYIVLLIYAFIAGRCEKKVIEKAIETQRIHYEEKVYYVIPWPEADKEEWAKHMRALEKESPLYQDTLWAYADEWEQYLLEQEYSEADEENSNF